MADVAIQTEDWRALPWKQFQRNVFRLQKRIYRAARRGDWKRVHSLQHLLLRAWSARCLAVRRVTQDNRGKHTPGVDGVASLTPRQRLALVFRLRHLPTWTTAPIRRVYIPKSGTTEKRALGIPVMADRALQALVKLALEPEWEARFEPNSYGFRPGRSAHDAIEAIFNAICLKPKLVLDADIEKCFDRIKWTALLKKLNTIQPIRRLVRLWLQAGIMDGDRLLFPEAGTPQGGVNSPLLANIALHGLELALIAAVPRQDRPQIIRYADDLVIICANLETLNVLRAVAENWLADMGLQFKPSKTRITHTLEPHNGQVGFDFLGFNIRQYRVGQYHTRTYRGQPGFKTLIQPSPTAVKRHHNQVRQVIRQHRGAPQAALIAALNRKIRGWTNYHRASVAKQTFRSLDYRLFHKLARWANYRHPKKTRYWQYQRYWRRRNQRMDFSDGEQTLLHYADIPIVRHVKVRGTKSPYDGDWVYWAQRLGRDPLKPPRVTRLLKRQQGRCDYCGLYFMAADGTEVHHQDGNPKNNRYANLALLHAHCHDQAHGTRYQ